MRIVVLGATGNLGTSLIETLALEPFVESTLAVARRTPSVLPPQVEFAAADITADDLRPLVRGADVVVHLAWAIQPMHRPEVTWTVNVGGMHRVLDAVEAERVPAFVYSSSIGAYRARDLHAPDVMVDESWPTVGIGGVPYSMEKAYDERLLDEFARRVPTCRVARVRPALVLMPRAGAELSELFAGPLVRLLLKAGRRWHLRLPVPADLRLQVVHSADVADALRRLCLRPVEGVFNLASGPVLTRSDLFDAIGTEPLPMAWPLLRSGVRAGFATHTSPLLPGWVDLIRLAPMIDSTRARVELEWSPRHDAVSVLRDTVDAVLQRREGPTPPLQ